jgi:hypothetical protein
VVELEMRNETNGAEWMSFACKWNTEIKSELDRQNYGLKPHSVSSGELEPKWLEPKWLRIASVVHCVPQESELLTFIYFHMFAFMR